MDHKFEIGDRFVEKASWEGEMKPPKKKKQWGLHGFRNGKEKRDRTKKNPNRRIGAHERQRLMAQQTADLKAGRRGPRFGVADGYTKAEAMALRQVAQEQAKKDLEYIMSKYPKDSQIVEEATLAALEVLRNPTQQALRLQAAKLLFDFYKAKPVAKSEVTVKQAEDWLNELAEEVAQDQPHKH